MTTAADLINRALRLLRVIDIDATADATQLANGLIALNGLIDELNTETTTVFQENEEVFTLTGANSYTIGSGGTFNTTRPQHIISAFYRGTDSDYPPIDVTSKVNWDNLFAKTEAGFPPRKLWYEEAFPLAIIHLWPSPASGSLVLTSLKQLTEFAATSTNVSFPPGYRDMFTYNIALRYEGEGGILTPTVQRIATQSLAKIKRKNKKTVEANLQCVGIGPRANILNDG
jgi:hypothetical protein